MTPQPTPSTQIDPFREYQLIVEEARAQREARDNFNALYINLITLVFGAQGYVLLSSNDINTNFILRAGIIAGLSLLGFYLAVALKRNLNKINDLNRFRYRKLEEWEAKLPLPPEFRYYTSENAYFSSEQNSAYKNKTTLSILVDVPDVMRVAFVGEVVLVAISAFFHFVLHMAISLS
ncbi:MAG: hypothetical protein H0X24_21450 [Ktedonobacterales bacterium]|nr:hypothetical protein [Ktedonobacterales bacterium]